MKTQLLLIIANDLTISELWSDVEGASTEIVGVGDHEPYILRTSEVAERSLSNQSIYFYRAL